MVIKMKECKHDWNKIGQVNVFNYIFQCKLCKEIKIEKEQVGGMF